MKAGEQCLRSSLGCGVRIGVPVYGEPCHGLGGHVRECSVEQIAVAKTKRSPGQRCSWMSRVIDHRLRVIGPRSAVCLLMPGEYPTEVTDAQIRPALERCALSDTSVSHSHRHTTQNHPGVVSRTVHPSRTEYMKASLPAAIQFTVPDQVVSAKQQSRKRKRAHIRGVLSSLSDLIAVPQSARKDSCRQ